MSEKIVDAQGRHRITTIFFCVSLEEAAVIDSLVAMSGKTKQDCITSCLTDHSVVVTLNSRVYRELRRIRRSSDVSPDLEVVIKRLADEFIGMGKELLDVEKEDAAIFVMRRE